MRAGIVAAAGLLALSLAAPAGAATTDVSVANFSFTPDTVNVGVGDTVSWHFNGTSPFDLNHSVTSDPGQADSWDSDPGTSSPQHAPGDTFSHVFNTPGTFTYVCKVHSYMTGKVVVGAPGGSPPPPSGDSTPPTVSSLRARGGRSCRHRGPRCHAKRTRITFSLSETAEVRIKFKRRGGHSPRAVTTTATAGPNALRLSPRRVPRGRYRLTLVATDTAGNAAAPLHKRFRVR